MSRTFLWSWLPSLPAIAIVLWLGPYVTPAEIAVFISVVSWFLIGLAMFLIKGHRSKLHQRLSWPLIAPYLALKWAVIALGAAGLVMVYIDHAGSVAGGLWLLGAPALFGAWKGLSRLRGQPPTSTPQ